MSAAVAVGHAERSATVSLLGGDLEISRQEGGSILMTGPAVTVFAGELLGEFDWQ